MPAIEVGRVCVKTTGREAGKRCVIVDLIDKNFVLVTGPKSATGVKRRRVNINHLTLTEENVKIKRGATDEEVAQTLGTLEKPKKPKKSKKPIKSIKPIKPIKTKKTKKKKAKNQTLGTPEKSKKKQAKKQAKKKSK
jgi:large subunit ribosomal protein L14e